MWIIFIVVLCLVVWCGVVWCDVTQCRDGGGYLIGTEPDICARYLQILSLTQPCKRACGSSPNVNKQLPIISR